MEVRNVQAPERIFIDFLMVLAFEKHPCDVAQIEKWLPILIKEVSVVRADSQFHSFCGLRDRTPARFSAAPFLLQRAEDADADDQGERRQRSQEGRWPSRWFTPSCLQHADPAKVFV